VNRPGCCCQQLLVPYVQLWPTTNTDVTLLQLKTYSALLVQSLQHYITLHGESKPVTGQGSDPPPFTGADFLLLCCLQVRLLCITG
jgi:hypothetical protein